MKTINMSSSKVFCFVLLALVSWSQTVALSDLTDVTKQYLVTEREMEHLTYEWTIKNFTLLLEGKECFNSSHFHTQKNDVSWKLSFCPKLHDDKGDYASVDLYPYSPGGSMKIFKIDGEFSILKSGLIIANQTYQRKSMEQHECTVVQTRNGYDEYDEYDSEYTACTESHYNVRLPELLDSSDSNDNITIRWEIDMPSKIITKMINVAEQRSVCDSQKKHLNEDFGRLLKEKKFSDVEIIVGNQTLPAHKVVLAARSPEFADLFEHAKMNDMEKSQVAVENMQPAVMTAMLEYIYTDDVTNLDEFPALFGLAAAADRFKLTHLKTMCEEVLYKRLGADNAADMLVFSDRYGQNKLKKHAMEFIRNHFPVVMETEGYKKMKDKSPALLMEILYSATDKRF